MPDLPTGTVTFLFTDIEDSTLLWERVQAAMAAAVERHLALLRNAVESHHGVLFKVVGDAVQAAFPTAPDALAAALAAQRALTLEPWTGLPQPLRVRMALHTAAAQPRDGDYLTPGLNRLARLLAAAHGGQVLLSLAAQDLARDALPAGVSLRDLGDHPLRDLYRPERVFQLLHPDLLADFPPLNTLATRPNNLPLQSTPFLGREEQVAWLVDALRRDEVRLVTITGPGGVGKTRLALQVAADLVERFPDGVWFVDLSALTDPSLVVPTMGAAFGMREGEITTQRLAAALASKHVLLVLDNFERVVEAAPAVAEVLGQAPGVKVLVTSRTPLHSYGEREYPLAPLPLPDPTRLPSLERLNQYEAVRLFIERAQAVKPDFTVSSANAPAVAEICSRLDGLPLAIELAAARVKVLPPQALLKRLEQRLPLLTGGARTAPARQQTMHNAIAWSHDLLSPDEQAVYRRLAVFAGGCTIEAAEAVAGAGETLDLFSIMAALVDESLLRQEEGLEGEPRFRMLETVREYGVERLEVSGEAETIRQQHAAYFANVASDGAVGLLGPEELVWTKRLEADLDNFRAALSWLIAHDAASAWTLAGAIAQFWYFIGHLSEGRGWLDRVLALPRDAVPLTPYNQVLEWAGLLAHYQGDHAQARTLLRHALTGARESGDVARTGLALESLGIVAEDTGAYDEATALLTEAIELLRQVGDHWEEAVVHCHLGIVFYGRGDFAQAETEALAARALGQEIGNLGARWLGALVLSHVAIEVGGLHEAARWFREVLTLTDELGGLVGLWHRGQLEGISRLIAGVALLAAAQGEPICAARLFGMADAARAPIGLVPALPESAVYAQAIQAAKSAMGEVAFAQAFEEGRQASPEQVLAEVEATIGDASEIPD